MNSRYICILLGLAALSVACTPGDDNKEITKNDALYRDVTETHLPYQDLAGLSMDAGVTDIDDDGDWDIIIANEFRANILLLNNGKGQFAWESNRLPRTERDSEDVGIADFDQDGDLDIIIVSEDDLVNELYLQQPDSTFLDASDRIPVAGRSNAVLLADINGDGLPDILIGNNGQNALLINQGDAQFIDESSGRLPLLEDITQDIEFGDVDGDGDPDLIVGNEDENRLLMNDGTGHFVDQSTERLPYRVEAEETREADFGDVDGDGDLDLLFANVQAFVDDAFRQNRLLLNDGNGYFTDVTAKQLPADEDRSFDGDFFDLDGDGDLDIITSNSNGPSYQEPSAYRIFLNDGTGVFAEAPTHFLPAGIAGSGFDVEQADFNGDGLPDLYLASRGTIDQLVFRQKE